MSVFWTMTAPKSQLYDSACVSKFVNLVAIEFRGMSVVRTDAVTTLLHTISVSSHRHSRRNKQYS